MIALRNFSPLLDLFLASPCPLCQRTGQPLLCPDCQQQLQDCRQSQPLAPLDLRCNPARFPLTSWGRYEGALKRAIAQLKYNNTPALAEPLGQALAEAWLQWQPKRGRQLFSQVDRPWVVPVPMHPTKQRQRGFNQAELIARSFCRHTGLPLLAKGVQRIQATQPQFELSPAERQENVAQAFSLGPVFHQQRSQRRQRPVLLLDDIYTTGATIGAIAQLLSSARVPIAGAVAVARAMSQSNQSEKPEQGARATSPNSEISRS